VLPSSSETVVDSNPLSSLSPSDERRRQAPVLDYELQFDVVAFLCLIAWVAFLTRQEEEIIMARPAARG
jgi:hypothetical protein